MVRTVCQDSPYIDSDFFLVHQYVIPYHLLHLFCKKMWEGGQRVLDCYSPSEF